MTCGDICMLSWDLESLEIWYIWSPNILRLIPEQHRHLFCHLHWCNIPIHFVQIKNKIFLTILCLWVGCNNSTYILHPSYFLLQWLRAFWKKTFIGYQGCCKPILICGNSCIYLSEGVCVLANTIVPSIESYMINYPSSVIMDRGLFDIGLSWNWVPKWCSWFELTNVWSNMSPIHSDSCRTKI